MNTDTPSTIQGPKSASSQGPKPLLGDPPTPGPSPTESAISRIGFAEVMLGLWAAIGVIGGIILAAQERSMDSDSYFTSETEHPFVAAGIGIVFATVVCASFVFAVLGYMRVRLAQR